MDTTNEVMASGNEVESAVFHEPVTPTVYTLERGGVGGRIDALRCSLNNRKDAVKQSLTSAKLSMNDRVSSLRDGARSLRDGARSRVLQTVSQTKSSMHGNPMKWAGIAAGSGFAIGMIGRLLQTRRNRMNRMNRMPQLVIIETTC